MGELLTIAERCDGVRCDMAMLVLPDVFERTWGTPPRSRSGPTAIAARPRRGHPAFAFMAEVYWDLEWTLQQQGFDYTYDKRLYDRLREGHARPVREHLAPASITRNTWRDSSKTTTSRERRRRSRPASTKRPPSSRSCRRACVSSTRARWRAGGFASRRTWFAALRSPSTSR